MAATTTAEQPDKWSKELEVKIRSALEEIRFGTVTLVIQDGRVIQIDRNEKIRIQ
ncbi:YezD family protein [Geomonas sp.]|uniref:YezD family protein n=1 Tax=Geomonas sp. TaxID=2651584 RepID=UPI002B48E3D9|nr:YezD family protein [Geomonas sp.]HJV36776.1 YezD family protein [Geomonas sp.]